MTNKYVVLKNITHPVRGLVKPNDPDPVVDLSHLTADKIKLLVDRRIVALATVEEQPPAGDGKEQAPAESGAKGGKK